MGKYECAVNEDDTPVCYCGKPGQWRRNDDTMQSLFLCDDCYKQSQDDEKEESVTITKEEYRDLLYAQEKLSALECHGVDNWEGYSDAMNDVPYIGDIEV